MNKDVEIFDADPLLPEISWKEVRKDPQFRLAAIEAKKEQEILDIEAFLQTYPRATGEELIFEEASESPDAICSRPDGSKIGVEITNIRRSPDEAFWDSIQYRDEMDFEAAADRVWELVSKKSSKLPSFRITKNILVLANCEANFRLLVNWLSEVPLEDWAAAGFIEIWLADFQGIREGAHREVRLFGLYPEEFRTLTGRSHFDQTPYG